MGLELLLPIVLFLITLIIIYLLRVEDRRDRRLDLIKKRTADFSAEVDRIIMNFRDNAQVAEERLNARVESSKNLIGQLDGQLADLQAHSDDLAKLQQVLNTYRDSISRLGTTTASVESRIAQVKRELDRLDRVDEQLFVFDTKLVETGDRIERTLAEQQERMEHFVQRLGERYEEFVANADAIGLENTRIVHASRQSLEEIEARADALIDSQQQHLQEFGEAAQAVLHSKSEALAELCNQTDQTCTEKLGQFAQQTNAELETMVDKAVERTDEAFKKMVEVINGLMMELEEDADRIEALHELLDRQLEAKLGQFADEVVQLQQLSVQSEENIRRDDLRRRELLEVRKHLTEETVALRHDLDRMHSDKQALLDHNNLAKQERDGLESTLAALSLQLIARQEELIGSDSSDLPPVPAAEDEEEAGRPPTETPADLPDGQEESPSSPIEKKPSEPDEDEADDQGLGPEDLDTDGEDEEVDGPEGSAALGKESGEISDEKIEDGGPAPEDLDTDDEDPGLEDQEGSAAEEEEPEKVSAQGEEELEPPFDEQDKKKRSWVEYVGQGEEEEISLDDEQE